MIYLLNGLIGILLLTLGRRLFWLFVGCVGFVAGLQMAQMYLGFQPAWVAWAVALGFGLIGALLAVFFQTLAIGIGGFAAGITITAHFMVVMGFTAAPMISLIGGIIRAVLLYVLFDWALIGLSSAAGSTLIVQALDWNPPGINPVLRILLIIVLTVAAHFAVKAIRRFSQYLLTMKLDRDAASEASLTRRYP